jgi:hypothetical protein
MKIHKSILKLFYLILKLLLKYLRKLIQLKSPKRKYYDYNPITFKINFKLKFILAYYLY